MQNDEEFKEWEWEKFLEKFFRLFLPTSQTERDEFMDRTRERVSYYQPRIERKTGIKLGKIKVKDNKEWLSDVLYTNAHRNAFERAWRNGRVPTESDFTIAYTTASIVEAIAIIPVFIFDALSGAYFRYFDNTLYTPFRYMNRVNEFADPGERQRHLDYCVVHELSHSLWNKLGPESPRSTKPLEGRLLFEGFATYCTDVHFADLYPQGVDIGLKPPKLYRDGRDKVEELVRKYGEGILLEIPKRWREFNKEFRK